MRSSFQLANTLIPFALLWIAMLWSLDVSYWLTLALAVPASGLLIRLFIIQHDCGHGSFFPRQAVNNWIGSMIGVLTLTPYEYWRRTHAIHHATSGNLSHRDFGEVTTLTVKEYQALTPLRRFLYRLYRNPIVMFGIGPAYQFILKHRIPWDMPRSWRREWRSVALTNAALIALCVLASQTIGWMNLLKIQLPITLLSGTLGVWLFYIQHQYEDTYWRLDPEWSYYEAGLRGSSYYDLPRILNWFTGNIGVHHVHHLCSRIPNYRLLRCLHENPILQTATRLTIKDSIRCTRLKLWDEDARKLVGFAEARSVPAHSPETPRPNATRVSAGLTA
ncbi:MAG: fatty acid desaturase [Candidatus Zixiibacteriota bacterium]